MQNKTLTSDSMSFFSLQDAVTDVTRLLYNEKIVTRIKVSQEFYEELKRRNDLMKFNNDGPDRFFGVPLEISAIQTEPYIICYKDEEVKNAN